MNFKKMATNLKVAVALHVSNCQEPVVKKVWRFDSTKIQEYSRESVEKELASLFPDVSSRHLGLELWYLDELVGQVSIESDGDVSGALTSFAEAAEDSLDVQYRTVHIRECEGVTLQRDSGVAVDCLTPCSESNSSPLSTTPGAKRHLEEAKTEPQKKPKIVAPVDFHKIISKCRREEGIEEDEQPLYIDHQSNTIRCKWCSIFKGSNQPRVLNQHLKRSKIHMKERNRHLNIDELPDSFEGEASGIRTAANVLADGGSELLSELTSEQDSQVPLLAGEEEYPTCSIPTPVGMPVKCQGLYDRRFADLHSDGSAGTTTAKKLWEDGRKVGELDSYDTPNGSELRISCDCCSSYSSWKKTHPNRAVELQRIADSPCYYEVCDEEVEVFVDGQRQVFWCTIRALSQAQKGACTGIACTEGKHPYTCEACDALQHGKSSQLLRRLNRVSKLKSKHQTTDPHTFLQSDAHNSNIADRQVCGLSLGWIREELLFRGASPDSVQVGGAAHQTVESSPHGEGTTHSSICDD